MAALKYESSTGIIAPKFVRSNLKIFFRIIKALCGFLIQTIFLNKAFDVKIE